MNGFWDDVKRLLSGRGLLRLSTLQTSRLVPVLYAVGLASIGLWAIDLFVASFIFSFDQGLWSIIQILVFGTLMVLGLRILCEVLLIFFSGHEADTALAERPGTAANLLDEVREAIHDLAEDDEDGIAPATEPAPFVPDDAYEGLEGDRPAQGSGRTSRPNQPGRK